MSDSNTSLDVLIRSVFDATGYKMNEAEANKLKTAVAQTGAAATAVNEEDAKGTDKLVLKKKELAHVINALGGQAVPELGKALSMLAYGAGPAAAIFLLVGAFELVRKNIAAANEKAKEFIATNVEMWAAARDAANDAAKAAHDFGEAMKPVSDASGDLKTSLAGSQKVLEAMIDLQKKYLDAVEKIQLAEAGGDKAKEEIVKTRFEALKRENDLVAESLKLEQLRMDVFKRANKLGPQLDFKATQAERALEFEQRSRAASDASGRNVGKDEKALKAALDSSEAELERFRSGNRTGPEIFAGKSEHDILLEVSARRAAFEAYERDAAIVKKHTDAVDALTKIKDDAVKESKANKDAIKEETDQIKTGQAVLNVHRSAAGDQAAIDRVTAAGGPSAALAGGFGALNALEHGQRLDQKGQQAYAAFAAVFQSVHGMLDRIIAIDERNAGVHMSAEQRLARLEAIYQQLLSSRMRGSPTGQ